MDDYNIEFGEIIRTAERERNKSDYQDFYTVSKTEALEQLTKAKLFLSEVKKYLRNNFLLKEES